MGHFKLIALNYKRIINAVVFLTLIFSLFAFQISFAAPVLPAKVVCIGSSVTFGTGTSNPAITSYPAKLQSFLGKNYEVINFGVPGANIIKKGSLPYSSTQKYKDSLACNPNIVIIMLGSNDTGEQNWKFKENFETDYLDLVNSYKSLPSKPDVFIVTPQTLYNKNTENILSNEIIPIILKVANSIKCKTIDVHTATSNMEYNYNSDKIHPNDNGAIVIAKTVYNGMENIGTSLNGEKELLKGQYLKNGNYKLIFQEDGNFVLYRDTTPLWALQTFGLPYNSASRVILQKDGNFCVYDKNNACILATRTSSGNPSLELQSDGKLLINGKIAHFIWNKNESYLLDPGRKLKYEGSNTISTDKLPEENSSYKRAKVTKVGDTISAFLYDNNDKEINVTKDLPDKARNMPIKDILLLGLLPILTGAAIYKPGEKIKIE